MSAWGGPCSKCGHPASYHGATFCQVRAGAAQKRDCDCPGYAAVDAAAPHLLAAHEAEVRAKVAAEIEAEARQVLTDDGAGQFERAGLLLAARIANPTTTEAAFTATCVPAGCSCDCHRWPGVSHLVACCSQPPFALANPTTTEADA